MPATRSSRSLLLRLATACACLASATTLPGCASGADQGGLTDKALGLVGLQTKRPTMEVPAPDAAPLRARRVTLRIHAAELLNTDGSGRSLSMVAKVYAVKDPDAFLATRYETFEDGGAGLGATELHEIVLTPGRRFEIVETVPSEVRYLGVVGLFRTPDDKRWRYAFEVNAASATGITVGAHGCALSVSEGQPLRASPETMRLAGVRCQ